MKSPATMTLLSPSASPPSPEGSLKPVTFVPSDYLPTPSFPSFFALVDEATSAKPAATRRAGLFEALLGNAGVLHADSQSNPSKYDESTQKLLMELVSQGRAIADLSEDEHTLLDQATVEFAQGERPPPPPPNPSRDNARAPRAAAAPTYAAPVPGVDIPAGTPAPFWWV